MKKAILMVAALMVVFQVSAMACGVNSKVGSIDGQPTETQAEDEV